MEFENAVARYGIGPGGENLHLVDKRTGQDYCRREPASPLARVKKAGQEYGASAASPADGRVTVKFGTSGVTAVLKVTPEKRYFAVEVLSVSGDPDELIFIDLPLTLKGEPDEPFAGCVLALNLQTNVVAAPRPSSHLRASCYPRFGFAGAKAALIGCSQVNLRSVLQEAVSAAPDLPHSPLGGPWALDAPINRGSYLFNFGNVTEGTVDDWIRLVKSLGYTQLDFHGGSSFRFGDCRPNPEMYPRGFASLKAVIDRLHDAGIAAGLHTYAFFMDKSCPWVTPVPDPRLGKDATFTLAAPLSADADSVPVVESTEKMSTTTGFFVRNSVTLQIEDELIMYGGVSKESPYAFTGCKRGAYATKVASHSKGAKVHHLKECFGLFTPDGDSSLLAEVAAKSADAFNYCGFDMMYLDALDGEDILGGAENAWHYGSKFVFELWKRLKKPALMEMSTFHHHLWFVRSRLGAWDHPTRSHKRFIDIHLAANEECGRMFLPAHLGWWAAKTWTGPQGEPTFADDIEYLCGKALGSDTGFSLMGVDPESLAKNPTLQRLAAIIKRYEDLRHAEHFPEAVKAKLRVPGAEFRLVEAAGGRWQFRHAQYAKHRVEAIDGRTNVWTVQNAFGRQPLQLRIEALMSAAPYDASGNLTIADFGDPKEFASRAAAEGVTSDLQPSTAQVKAGPISGCYTATRSRAKDADATGAGIERFSPSDHGARVRDAREASWVKAQKTFAPAVNLSQHQGLGVWIHGDGQGELLNFQTRSPEHITGGIGDHYVVVDFVGWRYFELIEPEGERVDEHTWPYGQLSYWIYRESPDPAHVESLGLWYNDLPSGGKVTCYLSPIKALPLVKTTLSNPAITVGGKTLVLPVEIESGAYLELRSATDCKLYGPGGELIREVKLQEEVPFLEEGANHVKLACEVTPKVNGRARVTVITQGTALE